MKAVILAGGMGTRLQRVTHGTLPKPMAELCGKPVLEHIVALLAHHGFREICCTLACMPEVIRAHFGNGSGFGVRMEYRVEDKPLGTAGAVKNCEDFYGREPFLVISGDAACDLDLGFLYETHRREKSAVTMALYPHEAPLPYGLVLTDRDNRVRQFLEKPRWEQVVTDLVNTGIYVIDPAAMASVQKDTPCDFARDLFPRLLRQGEKLTGIPLEGYWRDIGDPASYYRANLDAEEGRLRLMDAPAAPAPAAPRPRSGRQTYACRLLVETPRKARLMREVCGYFMESGADFTNGLSLPGIPGGIHIAPCEGRSALAVESNDADTAEHYRQMIQNMTF